MTRALFSVFPSALAAAAAALAYVAVAEDGSPVRAALSRYCNGWSRAVRPFGPSALIAALPWWQVPLVVLLAAAAGLARAPLLVPVAVLVAVAPHLFLARRLADRRRRLEDGLDAFLTALSDILSTVPNLAEALRSLAPQVEPPLRDELRIALQELTLGRTLDVALANMAARVRLAGFDAAVSALLLAERTGGDLPRILRRLAASLREMARLEGVLRTKTSEGRTQAWVMGLVPPVLVLALEKVDPTWLDPLWNDPIGWILLGGAAVLEVLAVALIRKIMAVDV